MCRIAGIFDPNNQHLQEDILKMRDAMHRGGPDDAGLFKEGNLALGHRRLSIIDLSAAGHQPMHSANQNLVMVYNGELYNFKEIRSSLEALGHTFHTQTDSEVVLKAFEQWGNACFQQFNGMFAMAIYNKAKQEITLARDHAGIKPLYYFFEGNQLYFASEIRAFKALKRFQENPDWKIYFLAFGHLPEPITTLANVFPLEKGSCLTIGLENLETRGERREASEKNDLANTDRHDGHSGVGLHTHALRIATSKQELGTSDQQPAKKNSALVSRFSSLKFSKVITNKQEALAKVKDTLSAAVERHLISDAPIGLFLSGGIDSSLLTILAEPILKDKLQTLSIVFDETEFSEKKYQDIIIAQTGTKHRTYTVSKAQFLAALPDAMEAMDQPSNDGINTYFICKYAKEAGLTAVLSGLGADELFGGYNSFANAAKVQQIRKWVPSFAFKAAQWFSKDKYQKAAFLAIPGPIGHYLFNRGLLCPKEISKILHVDESKVWQLLTNLNQHYTYFVENESSRVREFERTRVGESETISENPESRVQNPDESAEAIAKVEQNTKFDRHDGPSGNVNTRRGELAEPLSSSEGKKNLDSGFWTLDSFNKASFLESNLYMQNQLLKDSDYMSMWHSIEIRVPFLDKELMQVAYQISPAIKAHNKQKKFLLIHALGNQLPRAIWDRPKMGFTFPFQKWLASPAEASAKEEKNPESRVQNPDESAVASAKVEARDEKREARENLASRRQSPDAYAEASAKVEQNTIFDRHDGLQDDVLVSSAEPHTSTAESTLRRAQDPKISSAGDIVHRSFSAGEAKEDPKPKTSSYAATQFSKGNYNWSRYWVTQIVEGY